MVHTRKAQWIEIMQKYIEGYSRIVCFSGSKTNCVSMTTAALQYIFAIFDLAMRTQNIYQNTSSMLDIKYNINHPRIAKDT
jgi:hypothetical protein